MLSKEPPVKSVQDAKGKDKLGAAQRRYASFGSPVPVNNTLPPGCTIVLANFGAITSRKIVPSPPDPPSAVVPYRFPSLPKASGALGNAPLVPLNETKVVSTPLVVTWKTVP